MSYDFVKKLLGGGAVGAASSIANEKGVTDTNPYIYRDPDEQKEKILNHALIGSGLGGLSHFAKENLNKNKKYKNIVNLAKIMKIPLAGGLVGAAYGIGEQSQTGMSNKEDIFKNFISGVGGVSSGMFAYKQFKKPLHKIIGGLVSGFIGKNLTDNFYRKIRKNDEEYYDPYYNMYDSENY